MTFAGAMSSISGLTTDNNAAKANGWGGYVYKVQTEAQTETGAYQVRFVKRNGDQYVYAYSGTAWSYGGYIANDNGALGTGDPVVGTTLVRDAMLHAAEMGENWTIGSQSAFEEERNGSGEW